MLCRWCVALGQALNKLTTSGASEEQQRVARELAAVVVKAEDVELLKKEFEMSSEEAEGKIRQAKGNVQQAIANALRA